MHVHLIYPHCYSYGCVRNFFTLYTLGYLLIHHSLSRISNHDMKEGCLVHKWVLHDHFWFVTCVYETYFDYILTTNSGPQRQSAVHLIKRLLGGEKHDVLSSSEEFFFFICCLQKLNVA